MPSVFDSCTDSCGWIAAIIAALSYGSFGVPVRATKDVDVHPLVMQSYKTMVMFILSWLVVWAGVEVDFTPWGILSGFLWVCGGTGGIYAIRLAGLAIAVGTWASVMIVVNFTFGILIFREPIHDYGGTIGAFMLLICGLIGMSHFASPPKKTSFADQIQAPNCPDDVEITKPLAMANDLSSYQSVEVHSRRTTDDTLSVSEGLAASALSNVEGSTKEHVPYFVLISGRVTLTKRQCGIGGAVFNGIATGMSLIPLHYAAEQGYGGANYMISFATGALVSNFFLWGCFFVFLYVSQEKHSMFEALMSMPPWHLRVLAVPGCIAGVLLSVAMFCSILSVTYLGQGVGNSLVQTKILVSGLWGILWYEEIAGRATILKWFGSASITMLAIIWLSLERLEAKSAHLGEGGRTN